VIRALVGAALAYQVGPAATWLPAVRRLAPGLCGIGEPGHLALTFDDGPDPQGTPAVLAALDRLGWRATFFVLGAQVRREPSLLRDVAAAGHEVGLHGHEHRYLIARPPAAVALDLRRGWETVAEVTGAVPRWFRPPYGVLSGPAWRAAARLGMTTVLWSAWGRDWRADVTPRSVVDDLQAGRLDGGTALLHDSDLTSAPGSWRRTVDALPLLADRVAAAGLRVGPLGEHRPAG
jgi:peptidoglycan/xylan/chitin deacetylase (PgdA/CDA1 family)